MNGRLETVRSQLARVAPGGDTESLGTDESPEFAEHVAGRDSRAPEVLTKLASGEELDDDELFIAEAIILPEMRPAIAIVDDDFTIDDPIWRHLDTDRDLHRSIKSALGSIGRIDLPDHPSLPYGGTGFVVGPNLIMTNRHVAELFTSGLGLRNLRFVPGVTAGVDFRHELGSAASTLLEVECTKLIHPYWDMALLEVQGLSAKHPVLRLSLDDPDDLVDRDVVVVGYPAFDPRNDAAVQSLVFSGIYNVKRLQPGKVRGRGPAQSFGKIVDVGTHDSSTLGGNSGSAVFDPLSSEVVALHFAGVYLKQNYAVPMCDLALDQRVVDCGLAFADRPSPRVGAWNGWWDKTDQPRVPGEKVNDPGSAPDPVPPPSTAGTGPPVIGNGSGELVVRYQLPIEITVRMGGDAAVTGVSVDGGAIAAAVADDGLGATEKMVAPWHDPDYGNRTGYDAGFLGMDVPLPRAKRPRELATLEDGSNVIPYHHFSLAIDKRRRLPVFTASNVDYTPAKKKPEPGDYTRKGLSGLGANDMELWFVDPRLPSTAQLSDKFFTKDHGAFDRGHVVRREDVAWGSKFRRGARLRRGHIPRHELHPAGGRVQSARQGLQLG